MHDNLLYVYGGYRLYIINATDPTNLTLVSTTLTLGTTGNDGVIYRDGYLFSAGGGTNKLNVIDVSDTNNPTVVDSYSSANTTEMENLHIEDNYAYIVSRDTDRLTIIDISDYTPSFLTININSSRDETTNINGTAEIEGEGNYTITDGSVETDINLNATGDNYYIKLWNLSDSNILYENKTLDNELFNKTQNIKTYQVNPKSIKIILKSNTGTNINNGTAYINGSTYNTTTGVIETDIGLYNDFNFYNITVESEGYTNWTTHFYPVNTYNEKIYPILYQPQPVGCIGDFIVSAGCTATIIGGDTYVVNA